MKAKRQIIKGILGVQEIKQYEKYLGFPSLMGKRKKASFNYIKERSLEEATRLGGQVVISSRARGLAFQHMP